MRGLKYPGGTFLILMVLAMAAEGWLVGSFGPMFTDRFGTLAALPALVFAVATTAVMIVAAYYSAKVIALLFAKVFRS